MANRALLSIDIDAAIGSDGGPVEYHMTIDLPDDALNRKIGPVSLMPLAKTLMALFFAILGLDVAITIQ